MTEPETTTQITASVPPEYGTFSNRMLASIIDLGIVFMVILPIIDMIVGRFFPPVDVGKFVEVFNSPQLKANPPEFIKALIATLPLKRLFVENMLELFFLALYILPFWMRFSATPGKMLLRLEIRDSATLGPITRTQAVVRFFGYIVSTLPLSFGFVWMLMNRRHRGFHDLIAGTVVIVTPRSTAD